MFPFSRKVQEKLSNVGLGSIPRSITVCLDDDLADRCKPGDDVQIQGTVIRRWGQLGKVPFIYYVSTFIAQNFQIFHKKLFVFFNITI